MAPKLSVVSPVYNCESYVKCCYYTLENQTFTDWEWVVVDDGSTDNTANLIRQIDDSRIKLISYMPNRGRGYARSRAIEACSGDWMVVWDVDDMYFPDRLDRINQAREQGYDFCCSYAVVVDNKIRVKGVRGFHPAFLGLPRHFVHHTMACRMEIARSIGYDPSLRTGEDATITWILDGNYRGHFIDDALTIYQEDREVSLGKAIASNEAQSLQLNHIYRRGLLPLSLWQFVALKLKWRIRLLILNLMRLAPGAYVSTVNRRSLGETAPGYVLPLERLKFIEQLRGIAFC